MERRAFLRGVLAAGAMACARRRATRAPAHGATHEAVLAAALAGVLPAVRRGDRVLIKVNSNSGDAYPYSSSPAAVAWLGARFADAGARVVVGDRSFWGDDDTRGNLERSGVAAAARSVGARVAAFDDDTTEWAALDEALVPSWRPPVRVPRLALEAHVVNLACAKTHFITGCTLSLKNLLGLVAAADRRREGNLRSHDPARIHDQVAEIHRGVRAALHVIDAWHALVAGGPTPGSGAEPRIAEPGVVLASRDPVALDVAGIRLLQRHASRSESIAGVPAREHASIVAALRAGIGSPESSVIVGEKLKT